MRTMIRSTELGARTKVFFRVISHPVRWALTVTGGRAKDWSAMSPHAPSPTAAAHPGSPERRGGTQALRLPPWAHLPAGFLILWVWRSPAPRPHPTYPPAPDPAPGAA